LLRDRGERREHSECSQRTDETREELKGADTADPHHRRRGVPDDAPRAARVRGGHDRGQKCNTHTFPKDVTSYDTANDRRCDVVKKRGQEKYDAEKRHAASPASRQSRRYGFGQIAAFELVRKNGEPKQ